MGIFGGLAVLVLLGVLGVLIRADVAGLRSLPDQLLGRQLVTNDEFPAVVAAAQRISRWRRRGALVGVLVYAAITVASAHTLSVSLLALLAGTITGMTFAELIGGRRPVTSRRSASMRPRSLISVVGRRPVVLAVGSTVVFAGVLLATTVAWPGVSGSWTVRRGAMTCSTHIGSPTGVLLSAVIGSVAVVLGFAAAVSVTRRPVDHSLPEVADGALRRAGVLSALGVVIVVATIESSVLLVQLPRYLYGPCGAQRQPGVAVSAVLLFGSIAGFATAFVALVRYVLRPARLPDVVEPVAVP